MQRIKYQTGLGFEKQKKWQGKAFANDKKANLHRTSINSESTTNERKHKLEYIIKRHEIKVTGLDSCSQYKNSSAIKQGKSFIGDDFGN